MEEEGREGRKNELAKNNNDGQISFLTRKGHVSPPPSAPLSPVLPHVQLLPLQA